LVNLDQVVLASYDSIMPPFVSNLYEAKTNLSQLVDRAAAGEEIIIAKNGVPWARLMPLAAQDLPRQPGGWEGQVYIAEDFDSPLPDEVLQAFLGGTP
jgi:prevent-host-death family protein